MSPLTPSVLASSPIAVLGAGAWGTALAILLAANGQAVRLWGHEPAQLRRLARDREHRDALPGVVFPPALEIHEVLEEAVAGCRDLLVVVPSHGFQDLMERLADMALEAPRIAWGTKGLEPGRARLLHEVAAEALGTVPLAVVSGPTFAAEVAARLPTAVTVAANDADFAADMASRLTSPWFRVYISEDLIGVQLGGAVKNVLAIAAGIADGLGFGANTRAALVTRGLAEMGRLGLAAGGRQDTFNGLAGLGDLVLTCTDNQSRNRRFGKALGEGRAAAAALTEVGQVVEGVATTREVVALAARLGVEMPISEQVYRVIHEGLPPSQAVRSLLSRADIRGE
ncbi:MAG: NAD(P)H-dependent glycerol-3-phosphate dehydrogenase [Gammaproteobacteria bacterium]|nr:NAD(P)H-dependent glycerol-3-phosphate dehydrogenase [Gammaproteobacteria bacterium]